MNELEQRVKTLEKKVADLATEVQSQQKTLNETTITLDGKLIRSAVTAVTETIKENTGKNEVVRMSKTNKTPKLIITSDGENTQAILGGIHIGKGISDLEFSVRGENGRPTLNLLGINIDNVEFEPADTYLQSMKKFAEMLENVRRRYQPVRRRYQPVK